MNTERERFDEWFDDLVVPEFYADQDERLAQVKLLCAFAWDAQAAIIADLQQQLTEANRQRDFICGHVVDIFKDFSEDEIKGETMSIRRAWVAGQAIAAATSKRGGDAEDKALSQGREGDK